MQPIFGVQYLRFFAAMLVVAMHTSQAIELKLGHAAYWEKGSVGVDIFFVISGFVMTLTSSQNAFNLQENFKNAFVFLKRRFIRVVPLYWFYTTLKLVLLLLLPALAARTTVEPSHVFQSFFFIPSISPWGTMEPFLPVGWTLNFEIFFYLIFAFAIAFGVQRVIFCLSAFVILFILKYMNFGGLQIDFYAQTIVFEFLLGALLVPMSRCQAFNRTLMGSLLVIASLFAIFGVEQRVFQDRLLGWGLPGAMLVLGVLYLEPHIRAFSSVRSFAVLGDISYSIYLSHTFVVPMIVMLLWKIDMLSQAPVFVAIIFLAIAVGFISYYFIEKPLISIARKFIG